MVNRFNKRFPHYEDDSDYNTNAPSYYDDLARKSKLIEMLAKKIWEYDEELAKRFEAWDKNLEEFDDEVLKLLQEWLTDGTLDHIINDTIFNWKADQVDLDKTNSNIKFIHVNVKDYGAIGDGITDDSVPFQMAIEEAKKTGLSLYIPSGRYRVGLQVRADNLYIYGQGVLISNESDQSNHSIFHLIGNGNIMDGIQIEETSHSELPLLFEGNRNVYKNGKVYSPQRYQGIVMVYSDALIRLEGNHNRIEYSEFYNGRIGVQTSGLYNEIIGSYIHDNVTGIQLPADNRFTIIKKNIIDRNNLLEIPGADGILATRNVSGIKILENIITHSGEHGIYFQGDNSVIENNIVRLSRGSGIKLGSYTSDLYFYDDETVIPNYVGHNNIIRGNICNENGLDNEVNAGIYLQSGLDNIIVETNFTYNNYFGIRSVHLPSGFKNTHISINNNHSFDNVENDISMIVNDGLNVKGNMVDKLSIASDDVLLTNALVEGNNVNYLAVNRTKHTMLKNNRIKEILSINTNNENIQLDDNTIRLEQTLIMDRIQSIKNNKFTIASGVQITNGTAVNYIETLQGNTFIFEEVLTDNPLNWAGIGDAVISNNVFKVLEGTQYVLLDTNMYRVNFSNNRFIGDLIDGTLVRVRGNMNMINGNIGISESGVIGTLSIPSGQNNIVTSNQLKISDYGTDTIKDNNRI